MTIRSTTTSISCLRFLSSAGHRVEIVELAVDLDALEALAQQVGELLAVLALPPAHDRRQQVEPGALRHGQHPVDHLRDGLRLDRQAGRGRVGDADPRPEQAQVVVDLGDRGDRRARVLRGGLLLDRDRRRQAGDQVDVRLLHQLEELARIGRQALDVAPLALGVDRVEGEARLARAGQAGDHTSRWRGRSTSMPLRLCSRAPRMRMKSSIEAPDRAGRPAAADLTTSQWLRRLTAASRGGRVALPLAWADGTAVPLAH